MNKRGVTLVELMIISGLIFIIATTGAILASSWVTKARVEETIRQMYTDLLSARFEAMDRGRAYFVRVSANQYQIWEDTNPWPDGNGSLQTTAPADALRLQTNTKEAIELQTLSLSPAVAIRYDTKGIASNAGAIRIVHSVNPMQDCIVVTPTRLRLGRWNGANCAL